MDTREKELIRTIAKRLNSSANPPFKSGGTPEWSAWANKMQLAIASSTDILESLIKTNPDEKQKESEEDFLAKNLE